ncbi:MAG: hypothetical protein JRG80_17330 [Deltaproteobacteria bacterium]|nr:hypothetical protein [Deltaproteobacteria bacterium]
MITDVFWRIADSEGETHRSNSMIYAVLNTYELGGSYLGTIFETSPVLIDEQNDHGGAGGSDQILGGLRVGPRRVLCGRGIMNFEEQKWERPIGFMQLNGYLIDAPRVRNPFRLIR